MGARVLTGAGGAAQEWSDVVKFLDERDGAGWQLFQAMLNEPRRTQRKRESTASRGRGESAGQKSGGSVKELSEMSDEEMGEIEIPSFIPREVTSPPIHPHRRGDHVAMVLL